MLFGPRVLAAEQYDPTIEYNLKAQILFIFADLAEWPTNAFPSANAPFVIGILGSDPWKGKLQQRLADLDFNRVKGRALVCTNYQDELGARNCHLLFISKSEKSSRVSQILQSLKALAVFTVVETDQPTKSNAVIIMYVKGNLRYMVNQKAAADAKLKMKPDLLTQATEVF